MTLYLNHRNLYKSSSAFAPICNPVNAPWGKKAFAGPNGNDGYLAGGVEEGKKYDATELIKSSKAGKDLHILIDSGTGDDLCVPISQPCMQARLTPLRSCLAATRRDSFFRRTCRKPSRQQDCRTTRSRSTCARGTTTRTTLSRASAQTTLLSTPSSSSDGAAWK